MAIFLKKEKDVEEKVFIPKTISVAEIKELFEAMKASGILYFEGKGIIITNGKAISEGNTVSNQFLDNINANLRTDPLKRQNDIINNLRIQQGI